MRTEMRRCREGRCARAWPSIGLEAARLGRPVSVVVRGAVLGVGPASFEGARFAPELMGESTMPRWRAIRKAPAMTGSVWCEQVAARRRRGPLEEGDEAPRRIGERQQSGAAVGGVWIKGKSGIWNLVLVSQAIGVVGIEMHQGDMQVERLRVLLDGAAVGDDRGDADQRGDAIDRAQRGNARRDGRASLLVGSYAAFGDEASQIADEHLDVGQDGYSAAETDADALAHGVDRLIALVEYDHIVVVEIVAHPDAEVVVDPAGVEGELGIVDRVVPYGDAFLVVRNALELGLEHMAGEVRLAVEGALVDAFG